MNKKEYGFTIRASAGELIPSANSYNMILQPEQGEKVEKTATLGAVDIVEGDTEMLANTYVEYVVEKDVLNYAGRWRKKAKAVFSASEILGNYQLFTVLD